MAPPYERPSSVTRLAVGRCPATEKVERVLSVSAIPTTPGASVASAVRSEAAIGRRLIASDLRSRPRSEEHTSELQSQSNLVCRLLLEKKTPHTAHEPSTLNPTPPRHIHFPS